MRNHPIQNRQYNRGRLLMKISPQVGIRKITTDAGGGPEVMQTFPVMNVHFPSDEHSKNFGRPVTEAMTAWAGSDTDFPSGEHLEFCDRPVTESVTARAVDTEELLVNSDYRTIGTQRKCVRRNRTIHCLTH